MGMGHETQNRKRKTRNVWGWALAYAAGSDLSKWGEAVSRACSRVASFWERMSRAVLRTCCWRSGWGTRYSAGGFAVDAGEEEGAQHVAADGLGGADEVGGGGAFVGLPEVVGEEHERAPVFAVVETFEEKVVNQGGDVEGGMAVVDDFEIEEDERRATCMGSLARFGRRFGEVVVRGVVVWGRGKYFWG